jgi:hypothetical protein
MNPVVILILIDVVLVAPLTAWLADQKGRSPSAWFVTAAIAGPISLLAVGLAPTRWQVEDARRRSRRCPRCDTATSRQAVVCASCGAELPVHTEPEPEPAAAPKPAPAVAPRPEPEAAPAAASAVEASPTALAADEPEEEPAPPAAVEPDIVDEDEAKVEDLSRRRGVENVATGVFAGGISELGAGYRYLISISARMLYVSGPVDVAPHHVVFRAPRTTVDASMFGGDLVVVAEWPVGRKRQLVFRGIAGTSADQIVSVLSRDSLPVAKRRTRTSRATASGNGTSRSPRKGA